MNGIITLPLVPLRETESEMSEMTTQLLFGERVEILETQENYILVNNLADNSKGWVDRKMIQQLSDDENIRLSNASVYCISVPIIQCDKLFSKEKIMLPGGSVLPAFTLGRCSIINEIYQISTSSYSLSQESVNDKIVNFAAQYLNAPYLAGGKSIFGIDSSGLVQVVFAMCGIQLARFASQQVELGLVIDFLFEVKAGDLAFFENDEGTIVHVGILLNSHQIIHSFGFVKIDSIDSQGIISTQTSEYSHKLRVIKRLL